MKTNSLLKLVDEQKTKLNAFKFITEGNLNKNKKEQLMNEYKKLYSSNPNNIIFEEKRESIDAIDENTYTGDDLSKLKQNNKFLKEKLNEESTKTEVLKVIAGDEKRKIEKVMDKFHQAKNINLELISKLKEKDSKIKKLREEINNLKDDKFMENIEKEKADLNNEIMSKNNTIKELNEKIDELQKNNEKLNLKLNEYEEKIKSLSSELEEYKNNTEKNLVLVIMKIRIVMRIIKKKMKIILKSMHLIN